MQTETRKYNGYTNYETWLVKLWMDNSEGDYHYWLEAAREHDGNTYDLSCYLKDQYTDEMLPQLQGVYLDLLTGALSEVNWYEIAEHLIEDAKDEDA